MLAHLRVTDLKYVIPDPSEERKSFKSLYLKAHIFAFLLLFHCYCCFCFVLF
jgi:hypothetical protein